MVHGTALGTAELLQEPAASRATQKLNLVSES